MLRHLRCSIQMLHASKVFRHLSSYQYVNVYANDDGYTIAEMNKKPVNSMSLESMQELTKVIDDVEKTHRGLIITSSTKAFCAGLDLMELVKPDMKRLYAFWASFQELHIRLYSSPLVTIAAINGAAIAGGCALTLCCDYRVMAEGRSKIGLNTVHTGLVAPFWVDKLYELTIGHREAEKLLCLGHLCSPDEALKKGIVDDVVSADNLMTAASDTMGKWLSIPDVGRKKTKGLMRREFIQEFNNLKDEDVEMFTEIVTSDAFQKHILKYVDQLKKK